MSADRDEYKPRSKGSFKLEVKDHEGKPVKGEFSLSVFDSSVLYIQGETAGDIRSYYYGDRRYHDIREFHSGQIWLSSFSRDRLKWPDYFIYFAHQPGSAHAGGEKNPRAAMPAAYMGLRPQ